MKKLKKIIKITKNIKKGVKNGGLRGGSKKGHFGHFRQKFDPAKMNRGQKMAHKR